MTAVGVVILLGVIAVITVALRAYYDRNKR